VLDAAIRNVSKVSPNMLEMTVNILSWNSNWNQLGLKYNYNDRNEHLLSQIVSIQDFENIQDGHFRLEHDHGI